LGLSHGPIHAEFRINDNGVWPLEVAPRPIGGLCARSLRFSFDAEAEPIGLEELLVRHALGTPWMGIRLRTNRLRRHDDPRSKSGILEAISGEEAARSVPDVTELMITAALTRCHCRMAGRFKLSRVSLCARKHAETGRAGARDAYEKLAFKITPSLPVEHPATGRMTNQGS